MSRKNLRDIERLSRKQLLAIVGDPLAPAKIAARAYHRLEGMES
jgi:hypothetical protein